MTPPSAVLRPYVWSYGFTTGQIDSIPLVVPLPARPKQLLTFFFGDRPMVEWSGHRGAEAAPSVSVLGAQTHPRMRLSVCGSIDTFTVHFQPSGFHRLFGIPMTELTDAAHDARAVLGRDVAALADELGEGSSFAARVQIIEAHLISLLPDRPCPDVVAAAANQLFATHGRRGISALAARSELSLRQFERRFLTQVGVSPKLYARIIRFNAALDHRLRAPNESWSHIAHEWGYYDQMHLVHDWRAFTGESPGRFVTELETLPEFHTLFSTADRARQS